jgi:hypothetical protein
VIGLDEQIEMFKLVGSKLKRKAECMAVGGSAMLFYNLKSATKDVDLIFASDAEKKGFVKILLGLGFAKKAFREKSERHLPLVLERGEARFDIFSGGLFHFRLSPGMKERVREKHEFGNLTVGVVSPEDIILLKSATDREGDRVDAKGIIEKLAIDWDTVIKEALWQSENGRKAFTVYLFDFLGDLKDDFKADIPGGVIRKVRKISEEEMLRIMKRKK